jgi:hypothetical protein
MYQETHIIFLITSTIVFSFDGKRQQQKNNVLYIFCVYTQGEKTNQMTKSKGGNYTFFSLNIFQCVVLV